MTVAGAGLRAVKAVGLVLAALAALSGCASRPAANAAGWTSGRLLVKVEAGVDREARSVTADFDLRGDSRQGELRLTSPLGVQIAATRWNAHEVVLSTSRGDAVYADLGALSLDTLGEAVPLQAFPDWLAGRPWPGAPSEPSGQGFTQLGWRVLLDALADGRLEAVRGHPPTVTVRVRLQRPA